VDLLPPLTLHSSPRTREEMVVVVSGSPTVDFLSDITKPLSDLYGFLQWTIESKTGIYDLLFFFFCVGQWNWRCGTASPPFW